MSVSSGPITKPWSTHSPKPIKDSTLIDSYYFPPSATCSTKKIEEMTKILQEKTELCLSNNRLFTLRPDIWLHLHNLTSLNLSDNFLSDLPEDLSILKHLTNLNLSKNRFTSPPEVLQQLKTLKSLNLSENLLNEIGVLAGMGNLENLDLSSNKLGNIPKTFSLLGAIKILNLSFNNLKAIPSCVQESMIELEELDVSGNIRLSLNAPPCSRKLRVLRAQGIYFCPSMPKWLLSGQFPYFDEVNFSGSHFERMYIPMSEHKVTIRKLYFRKMQLTFHDLKKILANITGLEILEIGNDGLTKLSKNSNLFTQWPPKAIIEPKNLMKVELQHLELSHVPKSIQKFVNLRSIDLRNNRISMLPEEMSELVTLEVLIVTDNCLRKLPKHLGNLKRLRELRAGGNRISGLPEGFGGMEGMEVLDLYGNELRELPEGLEKWKNMREFDFDMNYVDTDKIQMSGIPYQKLRSNLRENEQLPRVIGKKMENDRTNSPDYHWSTHSSNDSLTISENANSAYSVEDWDEDSSDEFDFYNPPDVTPKQTRFDYQPNPKPQFVPNDIHPVPILEMIRAARRMGDYIPIPEIVDGQFDDA